MSGAARCVDPNRHKAPTDNHTRLFVASSDSDRDRIRKFARDGSHRAPASNSL